MKQLALVAGLALAGLSTPALADGSGFIRGEVGRSDIDISVDDFGSASDKDTTWGVRGGYWFNPNIAVEGFYSQLYSTTSIPTTPSSMRSASAWSARRISAATTRASSSAAAPALPAA